MTKRGVPGSTVSPSLTKTSDTVPVVAMVMVSLSLALVSPLPSTVEVMELYCTTSVSTSVSSPPFFADRNFQTPRPMAMRIRRKINRRTIFLRFFRGIPFHFFQREVFSAAVSGAGGGAVSTAAACCSRSMTSDIGFLLQRLDGISERRAFPPKRGAGPETAVPSGASAAGTAQGQGSGVLHQNCIIYARTVRRGKQQQNGYRFLKIFERFGRGPFTS